MLMFANNKTEPTLLIVDDQPETLKVLSFTLSGMGKILFATNGEDALRIARDSPPDVILLDIEMPGMSGYEVCTELKRDSRTQASSVIFVTAHSGLDFELESLTTGGIDFITKPINPEVCRLRIRNHLLLKQHTDELTKTQSDLRLLLDHLPVFIAYWDENQHNRFSNDYNGTWFGIPAKSMLGHKLEEVMGDVAAQQLLPFLRSPINNDVRTHEMVLHRRNHQLRYVQVIIVSRNLSNKENGFLMLITDMTERKLAEMALNDEKERLRITLNSIGDAVIATDVVGKVTFMNPIAEDMTRMSERKAIGLPVEEVMPLHERISGDTLVNPVYMALHEKRVVGMAMNAILTTQDGSHFSVEDSASPIIDHAGNLTGGVIVFHDVSEARALALKMSHLANHDALTDLPNRILLQDRINQSFRQAKKHLTKVGILFFDIDHFKAINNDLGHATGDIILQETARRLKKILDEDDTLCRFGGDEFVLLLPNLTSAGQASNIAESLLELMIQPIEIKNESHHFSLSIGISLFPDDGTDSEALIRHADVAMYRAKLDGRNCYRFYSEEQEAHLLQRQNFQKLLRDAIKNSDFELYYQGKFNMDTQGFSGMEALIRMRSEEGKLIPPANFIPLAEEMGLILPIDKWVLESACKQGATWNKEGHPVKICVNLSALQFAEVDLPSQVSKILKETGLNPELLELEITESTLMHDSEAAKTTLLALKNLGISIAIDDFGTGYSSLSYLKQFPVDVLKIDQSFVKDMMENENDMAIIKAIIMLAKALDLDLVAEGVEEKEQAERLHSLGCNIIQGYFFSRPAPADQVIF